MEIKLGARILNAPNTNDFVFSALIWGQSGCGKTTLASTAPGVKLWVLFDPGGTTSLIGRDDVVVLDLSAEKHDVVTRFKEDDPFGLSRTLKEHPEIETVILDSITAVAEIATENAVAHVKSAELESPGMKGYGHRNALTLRVVTALMRIASRMGRNFIAIAHEDSPDKDEKGNILQITTAIGGKMTNQIGMKLSEIWWMSQTDAGERRIAVRPARMRRPMKSRMFDLSGPAEFVWKYNPNTWSGDGIEAWIKKWKENDGRKLAVPTAT